MNDNEYLNEDLAKVDAALEDAYQLLNDANLAVVRRARKLHHQVHTTVEEPRDNCEKTFITFFLNALAEYSMEKAMERDRSRKAKLN